MKEALEKKILIYQNIIASVFSEKEKASKIVEDLKSTPFDDPDGYLRGLELEIAGKLRNADASSMVRTKAIETAAAGERMYAYRQREAAAHEEQEQRERIKKTSAAKTQVGVRYMTGGS